MSKVKQPKSKIFFEQFEALYYFHGSSQNWEMTNFHVHDQHEILLFLSHGSSLEIGNRLYLPKPGDLFFINHKEYHRTRGVPGKLYERYVLQFAPAFLRRFPPLLAMVSLCILKIVRRILSTA